MFLKANLKLTLTWRFFFHLQNVLLKAMLPFRENTYLLRVQCCQTYQNNVIITYYGLFWCCSLLAILTANYVLWVNLFEANFSHNTKLCITLSGFSRIRLFFSVSKGKESIINRNAAQTFFKIPIDQKKLWLIVLGGAA